MNRKHLAAAISLAFGLPMLAACSNQRPAAMPVGQSTVTNAVLCPEGYVTSADGKACVLPPKQNSEDPNLGLYP